TRCHPRLHPMNRRLRLAEARLYLVLEGRPPAGVLEAALRGGVDVVQLRDKELADDELVRAAEPFRHACDASGALFVLNDRPELVRAAAARVTIPWFAIGGIDLDNVAEVAAAGAPGVAVVRAIRDADDPEAAARRLRAALGEPSST